MYEEMLVKRSQDERKGEIRVRAYVSELHYMVQGNGKGINFLRQHDCMCLSSVLRFFHSIHAHCQDGRTDFGIWSMYVLTFYGYNPSVVFHINLKEIKTTKWRERVTKKSMRIIDRERGEEGETVGERVRERRRMDVRTNEKKRNKRT